MVNPSITTDMPPSFLDLARQHEEQRKRRRDNLTGLVAVTPVSEEVLREISWLGPTDRHLVLRHHPGNKLERKLQSLWSMLSVFGKTHVDLLGQLDRFHAFSVTDEMHLPSGRSQLEAIELAVNKELVAYSAAAGALVDFSRRLRNAIVVPDVSAQISSKNYFGLGQLVKNALQGDFQAYLKLHKYLR